MAAANGQRWPCINSQVVIGELAELAVDGWSTPIVRSSTFKGIHIIDDVRKPERRSTPEKSADPNRYC